MPRRSLLRSVLLLGSLFSTSALAGETPLTGPVPDWVVPAPALTAEQLTSRKVMIPLLDQQTYLDGDTTITYIDGAFAISNQEMLNKFGTISLEWQPAHGDLTVHRVEIVRGAERIDLMKGGAGFTVLRREAGMERLMLDGELTAIMQAQGLRIGDVLHVTYSTSVRDTVLGGFAQTASMLVPQPATLHFGRTRLVWPAAQKVAWKALMPGFTGQPRDIAGGRRELAVTLPIAKMPEQPKNIPARFRPLPVVEASSFTSWQDVATLMAPLYRTEGTIAEGSDLARITDAIAAAHKDPVARIAAALQTVQGDVRYQLITMGAGNYTPQKPADTWSMRYGDCKAKTLLLLAMLHRLGITAEPVLAHTTLGDLVPSRLPAAMAFDHVFVRAEAGGESFWLDGTGLGARQEDIRDVPRFGHVLPLRAEGAALMALPVRADARPAMDVTLAYDSTAGIHLPVPVSLTLTFSGYRAEQRRNSESEGQQESLKEFAEKQAKRLLDSTTIGKPVATFDKAAGKWTMTLDAVAYPDWEFKDGRWTIEYGSMVTVDFDPDRSRAAWRDLPALISDPWTSRSTWTVRLPDRLAAAEVEGTDPLKVGVPAVRYTRDTTRQGTLLSTVETVAETGLEVPPAEIGATRKAVGEIDEKLLRVMAPAGYPERWEEVDLARSSPALKRVRAVFDQRIKDEPDEAVHYADRAWLAERLFDWAAAEADYTKAIELDPTIERYHARADLRATRGNREGVLADAQAAFDLDGDNKDARAWLAAALSDLGRTDEALELLEPDPDPATEEGESALVTRAQTLADGGRAEEGVALLDGALKKRPSSASMLNSRCWLKGLSNSGLDAALADCTRAIELAAEPAAYYDSRAMVHFRAGRLAEAKADLDAALAIAPELTASRYMRGVVAQAMGDKAAATRDLGAARKLRPSIDQFFARYGIKP